MTGQSHLKKNKPGLSTHFQGTEGGIMRGADNYKPVRISTLPMRTKEKSREDGIIVWGRQEDKESPLEDVGLREGQEKHKAC